MVFEWERVRRLKLICTLPELNFKDWERKKKTKNRLHKGLRGRRNGSSRTRLCVYLQPLEQKGVHSAKNDREKVPRKLITIEDAIASLSRSCAFSAKFKGDATPLNLHPLKPLTSTGRRRSKHRQRTRRCHFQKPSQTRGRGPQAPPPWKDGSPMTIPTFVGSQILCQWNGLL